MFDASAVSTRVISAAYGLDAWTRCCALAIREVAMSSIAFVIFFVDWTVLIRRRRTRIWAPMAYFFSGGAGR